MPLCFVNDTATTEIYTLSLHDALPISASLFDVLRLRPTVGRTFSPEEDLPGARPVIVLGDALWRRRFGGDRGDRKSTRLNSSHANISYAVFCLKKTQRERSAIQVAV